MENSKRPTLILTGELGNYSDFSNALWQAEEYALEHSNGELVIEIYSPGGSLLEGLAIAGRIKSSDCRIITECYGRVASAAMLPFLAGDERKINSLATLLMHEPRIVVEELTKVSDAEKILKEVRGYEVEYTQYLANHSKKSYTFYKNLLKDGKDHIISAKVAKEWGLADKIN